MTPWACPEAAAAQAPRCLEAMPGDPDRVLRGKGRQAEGRTDSELISFGGAPAETGIRLPYGLDLCYALMPPPERVNITLAGLWLKCLLLKGGGAHCLYVLDLWFCRLDLDGAGWFCRCSDAWRLVQGV